MRNLLQKVIVLFISVLMLTACQGKGNDIDEALKEKVDQFVSTNHLELISDWRNRGDTASDDYYIIAYKKRSSYGIAKISLKNTISKEYEKKNTPNFYLRLLDASDEKNLRGYIFAVYNKEDVRDASLFIHFDDKQNPQSVQQKLVDRSDRSLIEYTENSKENLRPIKEVYIAKGNIKILDLN